MLRQKWMKLLLPRFSVWRYKLMTTWFKDVKKEKGTRLRTCLYRYNVDQVFMAQILQYLLIGLIELLVLMGITLPEAPGNSSCTYLLQKKYTLAASLKHMHVHVDHYSPFEAWSYHISDGKTVASQIWQWKVKRKRGIKTAIMNFVSSIKYVTESASWMFD